MTTAHRPGTPVLVAALVSIGLRRHRRLHRKPPVSRNDRRRPSLRRARSQLEPCTRDHPRTAQRWTDPVSLHVSNGQARYAMNLPAGVYTISTYSGPVTAVLRPNSTTGGVDLPQPGCVG